jgi:glycosyltransferase involved in cell wall biosynthesis
VTAAISCYNYGRYLQGCVESALGQTYPPVEVLVVDDGSTDDTAEVMRRFSGDPRVRYVRTPNRGQAAAKNKAVSEAVGDVVAFLDADDLWHPEKLARQAPLFDDPAVGVTFTDHWVIDVDGREVPTGPREGHMQLRRGRVTYWLGYENFVPFSGSAVRRSLLDGEGGFDERLKMGIDWELWLRLSLRCDFAGVPERLFAYRIGHPDQMSTNRAGRLVASEAIFTRFVAEHPSAFSSAELRDIDFYNACLRGDGYRDIDLLRSTRYFARAWLRHPLSYKPYVGGLRNLRQFWHTATTAR